MEDCFVFVEQVRATNGSTSLTIELDSNVLTLSHPHCDLLSVVFNLSSAAGVAKLTSSYIIGTLLANDVDSMHVIGELLSVDVLEQLVQHSLTMEALEAFAVICCLLVKDLRASTCNSDGIVKDITPTPPPEEALSVTNIVQTFRKKLLDIRVLRDRGESSLGGVMDDLNALWSDAASYYDVPISAVCRISRFINELPLRRNTKKEDIVASDASLLMDIRDTLFKSYNTKNTIPPTDLRATLHSLSPLTLWSVILLADACEMQYVYRACMFIIWEAVNACEIGLYLSVFPYWHVPDIESKLGRYINQYPVTSFPEPIAIDLPTPAISTDITISSACDSDDLNRESWQSNVEKHRTSSEPNIETPQISPISPQESNDSPTSREEQVHDIITRYIQQQQQTHSSSLPPLAVGSPSVTASTDSEEINLSTSSLSMSQAEQNDISNITSAGSLWIPPAPQPYPQVDDLPLSPTQSPASPAAIVESPGGPNYLEIRKNAVNTPMERRASSPNHLAIYQSRLAGQEKTPGRPEMPSPSPVARTDRQQMPTSISTPSNSKTSEKSTSPTTPSLQTVHEAADTHNALIAEVGRTRAMSRLQRAKHEAAMAELRKRISEEEKKARLDAVRIHAEMARSMSAAKAQKTPQKPDAALSPSLQKSTRKPSRLSSPSSEELERARRRAALRIKHAKEQMRQRELQSQAEAEAKERKKWEERDKKIRAFIERQNMDTSLYYEDIHPSQAVNTATSHALSAQKSVGFVENDNHVVSTPKSFASKNHIDMNPTEEISATKTQENASRLYAPRNDSKNVAESPTPPGLMTHPVPAHYSPVFMPHDILCVHVIRAIGLRDVLGGTNAYCVLDWGKLGKSSTHAVRSCEPYFGSKLRFKSSTHAGSTLDDAMLSAPPLQIAVYSRNESVSHECIGIAHVHDIQLIDGKMLVPLFTEGKPSGAVELSISFL